MWNIKLWSRDIDRQILIVTSVLVLSATIGLALPPPVYLEHIRWLDGLTSSVLLLFAWSVFRLLRPARFNQKWQLAEALVVPAVWLLLVVAFACWCNHLRLEQRIELEKVFEPFERLFVRRF